MPYGKGTYGNKVGRPKKTDKKKSGKLKSNLMALKMSKK